VTMSIIAYIASRPAEGFDCRACDLANLGFHNLGIENVGKHGKKTLF